MELDHVFVFVEEDGAEFGYLRSLGLVETYRRRHGGQGTANVCFCFDNMFLECLWVCDATEARSAAIARTGLYERSQWRRLGSSPFGFAWRGAAGGIATWAFRPPYLPAGMSIDVAVEGDDARQPMMFGSPGSLPPIAWPAERRGVLQAPAGLGAVVSVVYRWPESAPPGAALLAMAESSILSLAPSDGLASVSLFVSNSVGRAPLEIRLPCP